MSVIKWKTPMAEQQRYAWMTFFQNTFETPAQLLGNEMDKERYLNIYAKRFPGLASGHFNQHRSRKILQVKG